jgi:NADH-quinone oxidoreductase subunit L
MLVSFAVVFLGVALAWYVYSFKPSVSKNLTQMFAGFKKVLDRKYFVDEFYNETIVRFTKGIARWVSGWVIETLLVNRLVEWAVRGVSSAAQAVKRIQVGFVRVYLAYVAAGAALLIYLLLH